ncbi:MAG TPA: hypothetical protein VMM16_12250 [Verrucomicrobiae bacterium]|nr:hypothetical protein [Verrucomicrobiae bacterium]
MSIEKKSLISTLKTTRKANAVKEDISGSATTVSPAQKLLPIKKLAIKKAASTKRAVSKQAPVSKAFKPVTKGGLGGVKPVVKN